MRKKANKPDWTTTPEAHAKWQRARDEAQAKANAVGFDYGLARNDLFKSYEIFMLPRPENRTGRELSCEVVPALKTTETRKKLSKSDKKIKKKRIMRRRNSRALRARAKKRVSLRKLSK